MDSVHSLSVLVASLKMMFSCLYILDAYDVTAVPLLQYHLPFHPHT